MKCVLLFVVYLSFQTIAATLSAYNLGCSLTDQLDGVPAIAESKGDKVNQERTTIPGAGIGFLWGAKQGEISGKLSSTSFDILNCLAFPNGSDLGVNGDAKIMGEIYQLALNKNPETRLFVFTCYPGTDWGKTWQQIWDSPNDPTKASWQQVYGSKAYHEQMVNVLRQKFPGKGVYLFPIGHVMNEFEQRAKAGKIPGYNGAFGLFKDGIHLKPDGIYLQCLTAYCVYFKKDPHGAGTLVKEWSGDNNVSQSFATICADIVADVAVQFGDLTGVTSLGAVSVKSDLHSGMPAVIRTGSVSGNKGMSMYDLAGRPVPQRSPVRSLKIATVDGKSASPFVMVP